MRKKVKSIFLACIPNNIKRILYSWFAHDLGMDHDMFACMNRMKKFGLNPDYVIDIGAYIGDWSKEGIKIFDNSTFFMIEPQESKEDILKKIESSSKNIIYEKRLLGAEKKEKVKFFEMETGSSLYEEQSDCPRKLKYYNMSTLDELIREYNLRGKFFLKLDCQGSELDVLEGASENLKNCEGLLLEASLLNYNDGAPRFAEVIAYLNSKNFTLFDICNQHRRTDKILFQVDLMFLNNDSQINNIIKFN